MTRELHRRTVWNASAADAARRTGRPAARASAAASGSSFAYVLLPKPPPRCGTTMRMRESGASNIFASSTRTEYGFCVDAHTVSPPVSSQAATAALGSIA